MANITLSGSSWQLLKRQANNITANAADLHRILGDNERPVSTVMLLRYAMSARRWAEQFEENVAAMEEDAKGMKKGFRV